MKNNLLFTFILLLSVSFSSCKKESLADREPQKISLDIEGMTCEIGCARTIEAKLAKTEGVKFVDVNFENKLGLVSYDPGSISEKQIVNIVEQIAGGELYKVSKVSKAE